MFSNLIWITGQTRTGKTTRLVEQFCLWMQESHFLRTATPLRSGDVAPKLIVFAANDDNRRNFADRLAIAVQGKYPIFSKTPLGFFQEEVMLFWPLLIQSLNLRAQFPLRLRPETEQQLATQLWRVELDPVKLGGAGVSESRQVRRILDLLQLAASSGTPIADIPQILELGFPAFTEDSEEESINANLINPTQVGELLLHWQEWCLQRGFLTYGLICDLYWRCLLPNPTYQQQLKQRYRGVLVDDVDDYPAIAADLFSLLIDQGAKAAFTYNPDGAVRLGLNADPDYLQELAGRCTIENLNWRPIICLEETLGDDVIAMVGDAPYFTELPQSIQTIRTISRAQLLRQTATKIIEAVRQGEAQPQEIAIIAPGLDAIARYTLTDILTKQGIPLQFQNEQRPLISSPTIRALLTLMALVYPGLGRLVDKDTVAEMLVVLSKKEEKEEDEERVNLQFFDIDPVRAGLLADHCYVPHLEQPHLLPVTAFPRWDRLGYRATTAYNQMLEWIDNQRSQREKRLIPSFVAFLDRAIQHFLWNGSNLPYEQLAALRELMETAQHYGEVEARRRSPAMVKTESPEENIIERFIQLLKPGTVTANPYPVKSLNENHAVTLATIFQYRSARQFHKWHFWLDAGSALWSKGGAATLYGAELFLKNWSGSAWTEDNNIDADQQRLQRILRDLLGRVSERVYLCHSDLATNGQEQNGALMPIVNSALSLDLEAVK